jgi:pyridoxamine 5'-phosphate oxidase
MADRSGIFAGDDPFELARAWLAEAQEAEINDANAAALATVDQHGLPNVRMVLLKAIEDGGFVFYTNYESKKGREIILSGKAAMNLHWKSLRRQIRVRGTVEKTSGATSDAYYHSRPLGSRIGAWASKQSQPLDSKAHLVKSVAVETARHRAAPNRPESWGGFFITPCEIEFWADAAFRLHDRFKWVRKSASENWSVVRLNP